MDLTSINTSDSPSTATTTNTQQPSQPIPLINEFMAAAVVASSPQMLNNQALPSPAMYANLYAAATLSANAATASGFIHPQSPMLASLAAASPALAQAYVAAAAAVSSPQLNAASTPRYNNNNNNNIAAAISSMFGTSTTITKNNVPTGQPPQTPHSAALAAACALVANCHQQSPFQQQQNTFFQFPPFSNNNNNNNNTTTTNSSFLSAAQNFSSLSSFPMALAMLSPSLHALSPYFSHSIANSINTPSAISSSSSSLKFNQRSPDALKTPIIKDLSFAFLPQH